MTTETNIHIPKPPDESLTPSSAVQARRRQVIGAGGAVVILASLKTGSALAAGVCASPSSFSSIRANSATSNRPTELATCHSHGYWKNKPWPIPQTTTVAQAGFSPDAVSSIGITAATTLKSIIDAGGQGGDRAFAADLVSAYLDARAGAPISVTDVKAMWSVAFGIGTYAPTLTPWTRNDVRAYLDVLVGKVAL